MSARLSGARFRLWSIIQMGNKYCPIWDIQKRWTWNCSSSTVKVSYRLSLYSEPYLNTTTVWLENWCNIHSHCLSPFHFCILVSHIWTLVSLDFTSNPHSTKSYSHHCIMTTIHLFIFCMLTTNLVADIQTPEKLDTFVHLVSILLWHVT